jgi:hypothetical protein
MVTSNESDGEILTILRGRRLVEIGDVIAVMDRIDRALPDHDGLKWFNWLYKLVTEAIFGESAETWEDPAWVAELDVLFAELYFDGIERCLTEPRSAPRSWRALHERRNQPGIARVQFAIAGINAHVNRDLAVALVRAWQARGLSGPCRRTPQYRDYNRINTILEEVEIRALGELATDLLRTADRVLGRADDWAALQILKTAREVAWTHGKRLARLGLGSSAGGRHVRMLDEIAAAYSRAMLTPFG